MIKFKIVKTPATFYLLPSVAYHKHTEKLSILWGYWWVQITISLPPPDNRPSCEKYGTCNYEIDLECDCSKRANKS